jgi:hypothetical protein
MRTDQLRNSWGFIAVSFIAMIFALIAACGSESTAPPLGGDEPTAEAEHPPSSPTVAPTSTSPSPTPVSGDLDGESYSQVAVPEPTIEPTGATPEPTEPVLVNTPVPVSNVAPDFTLPSVQGSEYTLSSFRGEQPVAVVFYRAYW